MVIFSILRVLHEQLARIFSSSSTTETSWYILGWVISPNSSHSSPLKRRMAFMFPLPRPPKTSSAPAPLWFCVTCQEDVVVQSDGRRFLQGVLERSHLSPGRVPDPVDLGGRQPAVLVTVLGVPAAVTVTSNHQQHLPGHFVAERSVRTKLPACPDCSTQHSRAQTDRCSC